jgi:hypothetical protein
MTAKVSIGDTRVPKISGVYSPTAPRVQIIDTTADGRSFVVVTWLDEDGMVRVVHAELDANPEHAAKVTLDLRPKLPPQVSMVEAQAWEPKQKAQWKRERELGRRHGRR